MALDLDQVLKSAHENWKPVASYLGTGLVGWFGSAYRQWRRHHGERAALDRIRFERLYVPLFMLFQTRHMDSAVAVLAPDFRQRLRRAWQLLRERRLRPSWRALWDRRETEPSAEMSFGQAFPLDSIHEIVNDNAQYADRRLVLLVRSADRSRYEDSPGDNNLTREELALATHIGQQWTRLARVFERRGIPAPAEDTPPRANAGS